MAAPTPPLPPNQNVNVNFEAAGLGKLKTQWLDFAGELLEPMVILAAGGTKAQAAWAGMRGVFLTKVLGPLGLVAGAATAFLLITRKLVGEWRTVGVQSAKAVETLTLQFKPLLNSMELAKKRAREIMDFSVKTPFKFEELAEGNKILQGLTQGALASKAGMELVGDAAAVAGNGFAETARSVGRLYDGLMSGRQAGEAAMRLQELGLITGATRNQIDSMQAANAAGSAIWAVVQKDLERTKGAMVDLSESVEGLESTFQDTRTQLEAGFGAGFLEGEKAAIKSATQVMDAMVPTAQYLGETIGMLTNWWPKLKAKVTDAVASMPGFSTLATAATVAVVGLASAITLATGGALANFALGLMSVTLRNKQLVASAGSAAAAQVAQTAVTGSLATAQGSLAAALAAVRAGSYVAALGHLRLAAVSTVAALRTNTLAASQALVKGAFLLTGKAVMFVARQIGALSVAILASPLFWIAAVLVAAGGAMIHFANATRKAREEMEAYAAASRAIASNLQVEIRGSRTLADLRKAEGNALRELAQAHLDLVTAQQRGNRDGIAGAQKRVAAMQKELASARDPERLKGLDKDGATVEREDFLREQGKAAKESRAEFDAGAGPDSERERASAKLAELKGKQKAAEDALEAEQKLKDAQTAIQREVDDAAAPEQALLGEKEVLRKRVKENAAAASGAGTGMAGGMTAAADAAMAAVSAKDLKRLEEVEAQLLAIEKLKGDAEKRQSDVALNSDSELAALKEKVALHDKLKKAVDDEAAARSKKEEITGDDSPEKQAQFAGAQLDIERAKRARAAAEAAAANGGVGADFNKQTAEREISRIEGERKTDLDPRALEEARQREVTAELGLAQARIDAEAQVAALRLKGYEREKAMLGFEREKLQVAFEKGRVDQGSYERQKAVLDAQAAALEKSGAERRAELEGAVELAGLKRREVDARREGDTGKADALRAQADRVADARSRKDAEKEAEEMGGTAQERAALVERRMAEDAAGRTQERAEEERGKRLGREGTLAGQGSAAAGIGARVLELQGKGKQAKELREQAARKQDEVDRQEKQRAFREQGFTGKEADAMADKDIKTQQAERMMQDMGGKGNVIASSLAAVGGGGNVAGSDPTVRLQERMVKLLEDINNTGKKNVDVMK